MGKNKTVLFVINHEDGLSNVHVATACALLEHHPETTTPQAHSVTFHELPPPDLDEASHRDSIKLMQPSGVTGIKGLASSVETFLGPWSGPDHLRLVNHVKDLVHEIDPIVIALDMTGVPHLVLPVSVDLHNYASGVE
ncbi:hypothetical protein CCHL11_09263 [Colletotrichum chlorophyti]|uniref:Uncharacterized protein n=1 Tax=Colletotrichum chlorophyti TaxID=708187 RepID=A0A1Q8RC93_9PEZI|nr:hypothetical protein CCHL11_09263 [Colletotrichum chlorophyti]